MFFNPKKTAAGILLLACVFMSCTSEVKLVSADDVSICWQMGENNYQNQPGFISSFILFNKGKEQLPSTGWNIYFNFARFIKPEGVTGNVSIKHINGDFYALSPGKDFTLAAGDSIRIDFVSSDWAISYTDGPAGLYLVNTDPKTGKETSPQLIKDYCIKPFTQAKQTQRSTTDRVPVVNAELTYERNASMYLLKENELHPVIPSPVHIKNGSGKFILDASVAVIAPAELKNEKEYLQSSLNEVLQGDSNPNNSAKNIHLIISDVVHEGKKLSNGSQAYKLEISGSRIVITGADQQGVFYGIQTLRALMPVDVFRKRTNTIPLSETTIVDYPRFSYRGIHLDVARNFQQKSTVLKMLDLMAFYKLNKLHFHLSDDEGWRVEMKSFPELTEVGGKRSHDATGRGMVPSYGSGPDGLNPHGSGYYSTKDFIEILQYANKRHIEVIPKIDMPGHARAAIKAMDARYEKLMSNSNEEAAGQYLLRDIQDSSVYRSVQQWKDNVMCVCQESTYSFIGKITEDFKDLYQQASVPFNTFHIGADEVPHGVWEKSPVCKKLMQERSMTIDDLSYYFYQRVSDILQAQNLNMGGWEEIALKKTVTKEGTTYEANPEFINANFRPYVWNSVWGWQQEDVGYKLANAGYKIVLGNVTNLYFDLAYEKSPEEPGYYWGAFVDTRKVFEFNPYDIYLGVKEDKSGNPLNQEKLKKKIRLSEKARENILGIQGQLWSENIKGEQVLEYMAFPKLLALAERSWAKEPVWSTLKDEAASNKGMQQDWNKFTNTLGQRELPRLDHMKGGVNYRVSPPGAVIKNGILTANVEFPGLVIKYTTDGSEPDSSSLEYKESISVKPGVIRLKTFNTRNRSSRTVSVFAE